MNLWRRWKTERAGGPGRSGALPTIGEQVRLQALRAPLADDTAFRLTDVGVSFARVSAIGPRRLVLDLEWNGDVGNGHGALGPRLDPQTIVTISYDRGEAVYHFETRTLGWNPSGQLMVLRPQRVVRIQRREFYRLPLMAATTFRILVAGRMPVSAERQAGRLVNLSGGGALLASSQALPAGSRMLVRVPTGRDGSPLDVEAEVLESRPDGVSRAGYLTRLAFTDALAREDRDQIVNYIHEQQRIALRNRKLMR